MDIRLVVAAATLATAAGLAVPVSNLLFVPGRHLADNALAGKVPEFENAAPVLVRKCLDCHSTKTAKPFYAAYPVAKDVIARDIAEATAALDMEATFFRPGLAPPQHALDRLELVLRENRMPPGRYLALHWDAVVTRDDLTAILDWIAAERLAAAHNIAPAGMNVDRRIDIRDRR